LDLNFIVHENRFLEKNLIVLLLVRLEGFQRRTSFHCCFANILSSELEKQAFTSDLGQQEDVGRSGKGKVEAEGAEGGSQVRLPVHSMGFPVDEAEGRQAS
jgi:hypothetical protein